MATVLEPAAPVRKAKPTISERAADRICPNCGGPVARTTPKGRFPTYCDAKGRGVCRREMGNRLTVEGRTVIAFLKAWRIDRGSGEIAQRSLAQVCQIVDLYNAEDNEAGRPRADLLAAKMLRENLTIHDRRARRD